MKGRAMDNVSKINVTAHRNPEEEKNIKETQKILEGKLGDDFMVDYLGDLKWCIKPTIKTLNLTLSINGHDCY